MNIEIIKDVISVLYTEEGEIKAVLTKCGDRYSFYKHNRWIQFCFSFNEEDISIVTELLNTPFKIIDVEKLLKG